MADDANDKSAEEAGTKPAEADAPGTNEVAVAEAEDLTLEEAQGWAGHKLDDLGGSSVGKVEGVYVDEKSGRPEWLQARMGRFGHHTLVPARDAVAAAGHVWVPYTRDQIRKAPKMEPGKAIERDAEAALLEHYGIGAGGIGRAAEITEREASAVTAKPA